MSQLISHIRTSSITLAEAGVGPYLIGFRLFDEDGIKVYINGSLTEAFSLDAEFVDGFADDATITFSTEQVSGTVIRIDTDLLPTREEEYIISDPSRAARLNIELGRLASGLADVRRDARRSVRGFDEIEPLYDADEDHIITVGPSGVSKGPAIDLLTATDDFLAIVARAEAVSFGISLRQYGATEQAADNKAAIDLAIAAARSSGIMCIVDYGRFNTSGGHVLDGVKIFGPSFNHVDAASIDGTYSQVLTTLTVTAPAHGLQVGESIYHDFTTGGVADGTYTVTSVTTNTFTVLATSATTSGNVTIYPGTVCLKIFVETSNDSVMGTGLSSVKVYNQTTHGFGIGVMTQRLDHWELMSVEVLDYDLSTEFGFVWENVASSWTETGLAFGIRANNCYNAFTLRQNIGSPGTLSQGYNSIRGKVSNPPVGCKAFTIDGVSLYNSDLNINAYMDGDATARGLRIINGGRLNGAVVRFVGERPAVGSHTALEIDSTSQMRDCKGLMKFENGLISIDVAATDVNNDVMIISSGENIFLRYDIRASVSARMSSNYSLASATWASPTSWTEDQERPSGASNTAAGVFTAPLSGLYLVQASACFTPAIGDRVAVRASTSTRDFVLAQDIAETTDDLVIGGSHIVLLVVGDTVQMELYTDNGAGDTIRASDGDGSKTLFSVMYVAS